MSVDPTARSVPRAPRYKVRGMTVIYDTGDGYWTGPVVDASATGILIETAHQLAPGTEVVIHPESTYEDRLPFEIRGRVVRFRTEDLEDPNSPPAGLAVELVGLTSEQMERFHTCLVASGTRIQK